MRDGPGSSSPAPAAVPLPGIWGRDQRKLTVGLVLTITLVAFESLAVATVMPEVKDDLGGLGLYGWVFSGFFLASLVGIVVAGQLADRRGLALPFSLGLSIFAIGLVIGGAAHSMPMLIAGRVAQGLGAGAIPATAYAAIGRGYDGRVQPRVFATMSTAWVVPGLVGPAIAVALEHAVSWRLVFLVLLPLVVLAGAMAVPALAVLERESPPPPDRVRSRAADRNRLLRVMVLVVSAGAALGAGSGVTPFAAVLLLTAGLPIAVWAFVGLVPAGTVRLARGVPATIAVRGLLTCTFFAADAYVPLAITDGRGSEPWLAGVVLSVASVAWAGGSWAQARLIHRVGPRSLDRAGISLILAGLGLMIAISRGWPVGLAVLGWMVAGLGMGLGYAPLSVTVLGAAEPGEEGSASAALQLSDTLGIAVGTGIGGWVVGSADRAGWPVSHGVAVVFTFAVLVGICCLLAASRLPDRVPARAGRSL